MLDDVDEGPRSAHREQVYETFADRSVGPETAIQRALAVGVERFDVDVGLFTRVSDGVRCILEAAGGRGFEAGDTCPLERSYCRNTVDASGSLCVESAADAGSIPRAAYEDLGFETYAGCKLVVDGAVFGTICFLGERERDRPFSEAEELFVELVARLASQALERRSYENRLRRRTEQVLEEKRRLEGVTQTTFDLIYRIDSATEFTYVSPAASQLIGYDPEELLGRSFAEFLTPASTQVAMEAFQSVFAGEPVEQVEVEFTGGDGEVVVLEANVRPVYDDDDEEVVEAQGVARDVTTRRQQDRELRVRNRALADAQFGIAIADATRPDYPIVDVNDAFQRLTGYPESEVVGESWLFLRGEETDPSALTTLYEAVKAGEPETVQLLGYRRDETPFWVRASVSPVTDDAGAVSHIIGFVEDVTERTRTERLVQLLNRVLRHNLRNDMNVLVGYGALLDEPAAQQPPDIGRVVQSTAADLVALSEKARELERYARRERTPTRLDPAELFARALEPHLPAHPEAVVDVVVETDRDVCAGAELARALEELVDNALEHDPDPDTRVSVTARDDGDAIEITVADDGPGLPEMEAAIVEAGRETPLEHGDGLGLWLVNWVVTRYGGSFQIRASDSDEGSGTVATLRLPAVGTEQRVEDVARRPTTLFR
ncbi:PAS domain S-box protein [Halobium salinum]|uniref:PAS domain S-box protein n=1 Tax=Halobium salinum TaxID=1364940 RepID=A0ABD5P844_9EURY|nr:PAS domain-containing protein [Halobium salinum]